MTWVFKYVDKEHHLKLKVMWQHRDSLLDRWYMTNPAGSIHWRVSWVMYNNYSQQRPLFQLAHTLYLQSAEGFVKFQGRHQHQPEDLAISHKQTSLITYWLLQIASQLQRTAPQTQSNVFCHKIRICHKQCCMTKENNFTYSERFQMQCVVFIYYVYKTRAQVHHFLAYSKFSPEDLSEQLTGI